MNYLLGYEKCRLFNFLYLVSLLISINLVISNKQNYLDNKKFDFSIVLNKNGTEIEVSNRSNKIHHEVKLKDCNDKNCPIDFGVCLLKTCICKEGYLNVPEMKKDNLQSCNYKQKYRYVAFLFELTIPLGFGHIYAYNYVNGVIKFFVFVIFPMIFAILSSYRNQKISKIVIDSISLFWYILMGLYFLIDVVFYAVGIYRDGNGIELL